MNERVAFLLSKDPRSEGGGDVTMTRLLMSLASESFSVLGICFSDSVDRQHDDSGLVAIKKPSRSLGRIAIKSLRSGHSLVHSRFESDALSRYIANDTSEKFVSEHTYMAEAYLRARNDAASRLFVNAHVSEAEVWMLTRSPVLRGEATRIARDEKRVWRASYSVGCFDRSELTSLLPRDIKRSTWLGLTLPPRKRIAVEANGPLAIFLGDRTWPPNDEAVRQLLKWWPQVKALVPSAELRIIGRRGASGVLTGPDVTDVGFAEDLQAELDASRLLIAPILTGGGVRVKVLDAASRGLPVVSTAIGLGSLAEVLNLSSYDGQDQFIQAAAEILSSRRVAGERSRALFERNEQLWNDSVPQRIVEGWLG